VKWLIALTAPLGLPVYLAVRWSLWIQAAMLDAAGPLRAIRRSHDLVDGNWFRVAFVWLVMFVVVSVLQTIPGMIAAAAAAALGAAPGVTVGGVGEASNIAYAIGSFVGSVVFGALPLIAATLLYVDLRNRREGADLGERIDLLAEAP
jgi:hypothetical protein